MRRTLIELLHIAIGLVVAVLMAWAASWAVPNQRGTIWIVAGVAMVAVVLMGIPPLLSARRLDRNESLPRDHA